MYLGEFIRERWDRIVLKEEGEICRLVFPNRGMAESWQDVLKRTPNFSPKGSVDF
jgi:hypothetical protein